MKIKTKATRITLWFLILLWMTLIFTLSAQNAHQSDSLSGKTIRVIAQTINPEFNQLPPNEQNRIIQDWENIVRKSAHMLIYFGLGVWCMLLMLQYPLNMNRRFWIALFIAVVYAVNDELHQLFVNGRSCQLSDVGIDTVGALLGIWLVIKISRTWSKCCKISN